ncbi:hypothetical protein HMPREF2863_05035 [Micrococcus sp. HMSC067E09]|uniref:hypothetical protein n=1 Tax=Micrococcus sp. HMSC067E09 TaxID=1739367 RepID=UPI0008A24D7E|nr:hypothetical protein [Micrococcus sp. HMSC067E09]OFR91175.1 hypothetical protein HMPREF2863_05035 [Micrococcus sp. HMSC067E09]
MIEGKAGLDSRTVLVSVATGKVQADVECAPNEYRDMHTSPNGDWNVIGGSIISPDHKITCVGGRDGEKTVTLIGATDDGRAFGYTENPLGSGQGEPVFVDVRPGQDPKTEDLANDVTIPAGILDGNLGVHWNPSTGALSANPVQN